MVPPERLLRGIPNLTCVWIGHDVDCSRTTTDTAPDFAQLPLPGKLVDAIAPMRQGKVRKAVQVRIYIQLFRKRDHEQTIMRATKVHMLYAKKVSVHFETKLPEHPLQARQTEAIMAVRCKIDGVR